MNKSKRQEETLAKNVGGRRQAGSGSLWGAKGDVTTEENLWECKRTDKKGIRITKEMLEKIYKEAWKTGRQPKMCIEIQDYRLIGDVERM